MSSQSLQLYLTSEHDCGYLPDRLATNLVPDPARQMDLTLYSELIQLGYRRSGNYTYRPHCNNCSACIPCRLPVDLFRPRRNQQRCLQKNSDLSLQIKTAAYSEEHFELYRRYLNSRHGDGDMANPSAEDFSSFLFCDWSNTHFMEFRSNNILIAVAVTDFTTSGLSAVYSYFDPDQPNRSLGTYCVLQQIELARAMQLKHLYMGYWIEDCKKMAYKSRFQPLESLHNHCWISSDEPQADPT